MLIVTFMHMYLSHSEDIYFQKSTLFAPPFLSCTKIQIYAVDADIDRYRPMVMVQLQLDIEADKNVKSCDSLKQTDL